jgi:hypothetical protein
MSTISHGTNYKSFLNAVTFTEDCEYELEDLYDAVYNKTSGTFFDIVCEFLLEMEQKGSS